MEPLKSYIKRLKKINLMQKESCIVTESSFSPSFPRHFRDYLKNGVCQKEINNNNKQ